MHNITLNAEQLSNLLNLLSTEFKTDSVSSICKILKDNELDLEITELAGRLLN